MRLGRASVPTLLTETRLSSRNLRNALAVLIQQQLCLWYTDEDGLTYYEADSSNAYALVQSGKIIAITEERCGEAAGILVSNLLELGHCRVGDLVSAYEGLVEKKPSTVDAEQHSVDGSMLTNGIGESELSETTEQRNQAAGQITSIAQVHTELSKLLSKGFITPVTSFHFKPAGDIHNEAKVAVRREEFPGGIKGIKAAARYELAIIQLEKKWRDENRLVRPSQNLPNNRKRKRNERDPENKRRKIDGNLTNGVNGTNGHVDGSDDDQDSYPTLLDVRIMVGYKTPVLNLTSGESCCPH